MKGVLKMPTIYFDMDGTIADSYGVPNWLEYLRNDSVVPYVRAQPLIHFPTLARMLHLVQNNNYEIGILSWCSKEATTDFIERIIEAKMKWLKQHLPSVNFDKIHIIPYGVPKNNYNAGNDILFDDDKKNREIWTGKAYEPHEIFQVLKSLYKGEMHG